MLFSCAPRPQMSFRARFVAAAYSDVSSPQERTGGRTVSLHSRSIHPRVIFGLGLANRSTTFWKTCAPSRVSVHGILRPADAQTSLQGHVHTGLPGRDASSGGHGEEM